MPVPISSSNASALGECLLFIWVPRFRSYRWHHGRYGAGRHAEFHMNFLTCVANNSLSTSVQTACSLAGSTQTASMAVESR